MSKVLISNIQRFSIDDGPGIRTTVFFKGCSLTCAWCHNPECITFDPVLEYNPAFCISCGKCAELCPTEAQLLDGSIHRFNRSACVACGKCVPACRKKALKLIGHTYEPSDLFAEILKDRHYYSTSGGGVTFSGGEPALFPNYIVQLSTLCKDANLHIALDTAGNVPFENYQLLLPFVDLFLYDIKCCNSEQHKKWTGAENQRIIENLQRLDKAGASLIIRVPIINYFNNTLAEHQKIASFLASLPNIRLVQLLPYHSYGVGKYEMIGLRNTIEDHNRPEDDFMEQALQQYLAAGLNAEIS